MDFLQNPRKKIRDSCKTKSYLLFILSLIIVGFGQPAWIPWLAPLSAACGYALFWQGARFILSPKKSFWLACLWFAGVHGIQLSWMTTIEFQGLYILGVYAVICLALGLQFAFLTLWVLKKDSPWSIPKVLSLAGLWTIMEWMRFHLLCGFSWNTAGLALTSFAPGMQLAALLGSLGLSFWVMTTNLLAYRAKYTNFRMQPLLCWLAVALLPYLYGIASLTYHDFFHPSPTSLYALLVQPGLLPSEKIPLHARKEEFISPWHQWLAICKFLQNHLENYPNKRAQLIALPESAVPFRADHAVYDYRTACYLLFEVFGKESLKSIPDLIPPFSHAGKVSNAFFCQFLSNYFRADLIIGLDDQEGQDCYEAALHFSPWQDTINRYEKRVLVPLAEYLPFAWCSNLTKAYGVESFYTPGKEAKVFPCSFPLSVSICYEETFPNLMREGRLKGAVAFVNITNDNWYPNSRLPQQHFDHGKLRAVENGVPLFRACNTGITSSVDAQGRLCNKFDDKQGVLFAEAPNYQINTIYTLFGDSLIIGISIGLILFYLVYLRMENLKKSTANILHLPKKRRFR